MFSDFVFFSDFVTNYDLFCLKHVKPMCFFMLCHKLFFSDSVTNYVFFIICHNQCVVSDLVINYSVSDFATHHVLSLELVTKYVVSAKSQTLCVSGVFRF